MGEEIEVAVNQAVENYFFQYSLSNFGYLVLNINIWKKGD